MFFVWRDGRRSDGEYVGPPAYPHLRVVRGDSEADRDRDGASGSTSEDLSLSTPPPPLRA